MEIATVPVIIALVELLKKSGMSSQMAPTMSLVLGLLAGFVFVEGDWTSKLAFGIMLGLTSSGLYSGAKASIGVK